MARPKPSSDHSFALVIAISAGAEHDKLSRMIEQAQC
jgi:hypothetical protein